MKPKIYKALSILLAIAILVSTCVCAIGTVAAKEATYYVSTAAGDTKNGSEENPFSTVSEAIQYANDQEYGEGDIVTIKIVDTDSTDTTYVQWGSGEVIEYNYKLYVTSDVAGTIVDISNSAHLYGETDISKITLKVSNGYPNVYLYNQNQTIMNGAAMTSRNLLLGGYTKGDVEINHDVNVNLCIANAIILGSTYKNAVYNKNINITYDTTGAPTILPGGDSNNVTTTYNSNININFKNAKGVTFKNRYGTVVYGANAAVQVINSTGVEAITAEAEPFLSVTKTDGKPLPRWTITNNSSYKDAITFTDTAGVYKIDKTMNASVTNSSGEVIEATLVNDYDNFKTLDIRKFGVGEYTVEIFPEPKEYTYYVSATGDDTIDETRENPGSKDDPFLTFTTAITQINNVVTNSRDTVNLIILGTDKVYWGTTSPTYPYTLKITSETNGTILDTDGATSNMVKLGGKTYFDNFTLMIDGGENSGQFSLRGNDLTTGSNFTNGSQRLWHLDDSGSSTTKDSNVEFNNPLKAAFILGSANASTTTFEKDINITFNNATVSPSFLFGHSGNKLVTYNSNINFNFKNAKGVSFGNRGSGTKTFGPNAAIQVINSTGVDTITADNSGFDAITDTVLSSDATKTIADVPRWTINNATDDKDALSFVSGEAGKYKINIDTTVYNVKVADSSGADITATVVKDGYIDIKGAGLAAGTYTVTVEEAESHNYDKYINYRNGLGNTYSKLTTDKNLSVVYFGGSVTAGTGSSDSEVTSWRARVGNWLNTNFPAANVTNYKQAIGETGTYLGCYRVAKDVVSKAPDLLFIEYSINDYYDSASYDRAQMQFETIVREVKNAYPNCDIVTILVTNYGTVENARKNIMHGAAQAHEDICKAYNIPSIYVGGALGDALGETWTAKDNYEDDDVWMNYVADSVHPNDAGYEIYYNVIKEFLNNELKYGGYDGTIETTPMPTIQNKYKYLFDGDITYIDESDSSKVTYTGDITCNPDANPGIVSIDDYKGLIEVPAGSKDTVTVKFTGTELIMLCASGHDNSANNTFEVSIDGSEWITGKYTNKNPIVIAAGLDSGEHTAVIRPSSVNKMRIAGFFSRDVEKSTNILDVRDLVNANEKITANTTEAYFDYNNDDVIDQKDVATVRKILLNNK